MTSCLNTPPPCAASNLFYLQRILPRAKGLVEMMANGADNQMEITEENSGFYG